MVAALRRIGFDRVFDTSFTADLTIMEEASELAQRIQTGRRAADVYQLLARLDQVRGAVLSRFHPEPVNLQEPAADDGRDHQELLCRTRSGRSGQDRQRLDHALHGQEVRMQPSGNGAATMSRMWIMC